MEKFIKLFVSGAGQNKGDILIPVKGIMEIKQVSDTVVNIFYNSISSAQAGYAIANDGSATVPAQTNVVQTYKITHDAIVANSSSFKDFLNGAVENCITIILATTSLFTKRKLIPAICG